MMLEKEKDDQKKNDVEFSKALSSKRRLDILRLLSNEQMSVKEIADSLSLKSAAVRHHIRTLARSSLIEEVGEEMHNFGRPTMLYKAKRTPVSLEFRKRRYDLLAEFLIQALFQNIPLSKVAKTLRDIGYQAGEELINDLARHNGIRQWDMRLLKQYFVDGYLNELGSEPEVIRVDDKELVFRIHNCVFSEVSHKYPEIICNGLDQGMRDGILERSLGHVEQTRTKCRGHGDQYCEFIFNLKPPETELTKKEHAETAA